MPTAVSLIRAQQDVYEFCVAEDLHINVRNTSYDEPGHVYSVRVEDGLPVACSCPADEHYDPACKHRLAVLIREPVMDAVRPTVADGGSTCPE